MSEELKVTEVEETTEVETEETETEVNTEEVEATEEDKRKVRFKKLSKQFNELKKKVGEDDAEVDVEKIVEQKLQQRQILDKVEYVKQQIPEQYREVFEKEFTELTEGKTLSPETVEKYIKSAVALSIPDDKDDADAVKAMAIGNSANGGSKTDTVSKKQAEYSTKFLKEQGIL